MVKHASRLLTATFVVVAATVLAACGSSDSSDSTNDSSASTSAAAPGLVESQAILDKYSKPSSFGELPKITKAIPTGKRIDFVSCGPAACLDQPKAFREAAKVLGWETKIINGGTNPQANQNAMKQAVRDAPAAVLWNGLDSSVFKAQLDELEAKGIPVIALQTLDKQNPPKFVGLPGISMYDDQAEATAASAVIAAEGKGEIALISVPFPIYQLYNPKIKDNIKKLCPECKVKDFDMPVTSIGTDAASRIVNFLRANPDIKTLIHDAPGTASGLDAALQGANITDTKNIVINASIESIPDIANGKTLAGIPLASNEISWLAADALARIFTDESPQVSIDAGAPVLVWTKDNVPDGANGLPPNLPDYQAFFKETWGK